MIAVMLVTQSDKGVDRFLVEEKKNKSYRKELMQPADERGKTVTFL